MTLLIAGLAALLVGPLLVACFSSSRHLRSGLDGFVVVAICGLLLVHIIPECIAIGGWWAVAAAVVGIFIPQLAEGALFHRGHHGHHSRFVSVLALLGLAVSGLISMINSSLAGAAMTREYARAAMLAKTRMNELLVMKPLPLGAPMAGKFNETSGWEAVAQPTLGFGASATGSQVVRVDLKVWWQSGNERRSIDIEGYRRVRIR